MTYEVADFAAAQALIPTLPKAPRGQMWSYCARPYTGTVYVFLARYARRGK